MSGSRFAWRHKTLISLFSNFNSYKTMAYGSKKRFSSRRGTRGKGGKKSFKRKSSKKVLRTYRMSRGGGRL